jgi:hypothetical protein
MSVQGFQYKETKRLTIASKSSISRTAVPRGEQVVNWIRLGTLAGNHRHSAEVGKLDRVGRHLLLDFLWSQIRNVTGWVEGVVDDC